MTTLEAGAVASAARRLEGIVNRTPVLTSRTLNEMTGHDVFFKCENFQRVGAFKFRGAYNAIASLDSDRLHSSVITHSSGNHAQGVALAATLLGVRAIIVMPEDASAVKRQATAGYGAEIVPCEAIEREDITAQLVERHGHTLIHPYDDDHIIAGQGTAAWELFEEVGQLDLLFVPVGGGGLVSGSALAASSQSPECRVIGVEPEIADDARRSWLAGDIVELDRVPITIADGLRPRFIGRRNLAVMRRHVADMITVSESEIIHALQFIWQRMKIIVEPSAAVALAPVLSGRFVGSGRRVGILLSGGNVDLPTLALRLDEIDARRPMPEAAEAEVAASDQRPKILVTEPASPDFLAAMRNEAQVDIKTGLEEEELQDIIGPYHGLVVAENTPVSSQVIEYGYSLRFISSSGSRLDNIDVSAARALGIDVHYDPGIKAVNEAEATLGHMLDLLNWQNLGSEGAVEHGLAGKTLGLVGFGRTGLQVAQRAASFDMQVLVNQPRLTPELALSAGVTVTELNTLLSEADIVSLHLPSNAETSRMIGRRHLDRMKPDAFLINPSHFELLDVVALLQVMERGHLGGAAIIAPSDAVAPDAADHLDKLKAQRRILLLPQSVAARGDQPADKSTELIDKTLASLRTRLPSESLSLDVLPVEHVLPHEMIDEKRVARLMSLLERDGRLVNPPVVLPWQGRYIVLDGATRYTALARLGYSYIIAQVVSAASPEFELHTWFHVISGRQPFSALQQELVQLPDLYMTEMTSAELPMVFVNRPAAICYFVDRQGGTTLAEAFDARDKLTVMKEMVSHYTAYGKVERTLLADLGRLKAHFPDMIAAAVFPQLKPEEVFAAAARGDNLPAGLTRFVISGRILRLNASLERLKRDEPLADKRVWLNRLLADRLAASRLRYYQEPVVLLDE
ncbi:MAG: pyridoxal-phosphate dependent enzyme [Chloroflexota bacterium]|nr:MAG: pyridoxal-phosphate dependent enzyme [Chloroflexota bacterium]